MNIQQIRESYPQYDDMSDEQLAKALHGKFYSDMDFNEFAGKIGFEVENPVSRQVGLTARAGLQAINDIPNMVVDPFVNLYNYATDSSVPTFASRQEQVYNEAGLPAPRDASERIANIGMRTLGGAAAAKWAGAAGNGLMQFLAEKPTAQVTAGLASSGAIEQARNMGVDNPYALMGIGMTAGMGPGALGTGLRVPATRSGLTADSREIIGGKLLNTFATDREKAIANLSASQQTVPGSQPMTGGASMDPGLAGLERSVRSLDSQNQIGQQIVTNNQARLAELDRLSGANKLNYAQNKRSAVGDSLREPALNGAGPVNLPRLMQNADMIVVNGPKREVVQKALAWARGRLDDASSGDVRDLYAIRQDIQNARQGIYDKPGAPYSTAKKELGDMLRVIDNEIERVAPGMAEYRRKYAATSRAIDQMTEMQDVRNVSSRGQMDIQGSDVLSASTLRNQINRRVLDNPDTVLSAAQQRRLEVLLKDIDMGMASVGPGVKPPGSDTFKNMTFANIMGKVVGDNVPSGNKTMEMVARPFQWLANFTDDQVRSLLVEAMLDPMLAAQMMRKASAAEAQTLSAALKAKAQSSGIGASKGTAEGL